MPKALVCIRGETLVVHAVRRLIAAGGVSHVVIVVPEGHESEFAAQLASVDVAQVRVELVVGGRERSDSVRCGLRALNRECDVVLVHDAARALAPAGLVGRVLAAVQAGADAVVPAVPVADTIKIAEPLDEGQGHLKGLIPGAERVVSTPSRQNLRAVQTPQGFRRSALVAAHESGRDATDDAALIEVTGGDVVVIPGDLMALKVTTPIDLVVAEHLLSDPTEVTSA